MFKLFQPPPPYTMSTNQSLIDAEGCNPGPGELHRVVEDLVAVEGTAQRHNHVLARHPRSQRALQLNCRELLLHSGEGEGQRMSAGVCVCVCVRVRVCVCLCVPSLSVCRCLCLYLHVLFLAIDTTLPMPHQLPIMLPLGPPPLRRHCRPLATGGTCHHVCPVAQMPAASVRTTGVPRHPSPPYLRGRSHSSRLFVDGDSTTTQQRGR